MISDNGGVHSSLDDYFLGKRKIKEKRVSSMLVSSSFGANAILYSIWLGYIMGAWALIIHIAWCMSFVLLSKYSEKIYNYTGLHDFLGSKFGKTTQKVAALCSMIGLFYFLGWEIAITQTGIESIIVSTGIESASYALSLVLIVSFVAIIYTIIGGRRMNGLIDSFVNKIKSIIMFVLAVALFFVVCEYLVSDFNIFFPSFSIALMEIGFIGFFINILFNLSWQFVDNSSWQTISSGSNDDSKHTKSSLLGASKGIFIAYFFGTAIGLMMRCIPNLTSDNIIGQISLVIGGDFELIFGLLIVILLLFSMMTLIDSISLSITQSLAIDIGLIREKTLTAARLMTLFVGIIAVFGVQLILNLMDLDIFSFVYIVIISQLSLIGPILVGLILKQKKIPYMWAGMLLGLFIGMTIAMSGNHFNIGWLSDIGGLVAALISVIVSLLLYINYGKNIKIET